MLYIKYSNIYPTVIKLKKKNKNIVVLILLLHTMVSRVYGLKSVDYLNSSTNDEMSQDFIGFVLCFEDCHEL